MPSPRNSAKILLSISFTVIVAFIAVTLGFGSGNTIRTTILRPIQPALKVYSSGIVSRLFSTTGISTSPALHSTATASTAQSIVRSMTNSTEYKRGEVYFLSHGGPPTMFDTQSKPYKAWQKYGAAVEAAKPRGLVVVSAHWENEDGSADVKVNTDTTNPLVYDFYNFPKQYYEQTFHSHGDANMVVDIQEALKGAEVEVEPVKRGLDHGVWVPFKVAFGGKTDIPIVQVSLPGDGSPVSSAKLGKALASLRDKGYGIMGTGQAVHNLRDLFSGRPAPYTAPFMSAITSALSSSKPLEATLTLFRHPMYHQAHPTPEHLLPLAVAVAATHENDRLEELFAGTAEDGKLGWGMWFWKPQQ